MELSVTTKLILIKVFSLEYKKEEHCEILKFLF